MLSAQKEDTRLIPDDVPSDSPLLGPFSKVVNSIQGLQERLDSFSADDIGDTHDNVQTLLSRLSDLQQKLTTFCEIKVSVGVVRDVVEEALRQYTNADTLEETETRTFIQPLSQGNKLIHFPRSNKSTKTPGAELTLSNELEVPEVVVHLNDASISGIFKEHESVNAAEAAAPINAAAVDLQPIIQPETATESIADEQNNSEDQLESQITDLSPAMLLAPFVTTDSKSETTYESEADTCYPEAPEISAVRPQALPPIDLSSETATIETSKDPVAVRASSEFDQRLLDDLIKNYGEFLVNQSVPQTSKPTDTFVMAAPEAAVPVAATRSIDSDFETQNLPITKTNGELDRQLKQLIKDYGEYDLYSRRSPLNLKTGVIAAFLLLALIFSGLYYFSPKALVSQNSPAPQSRPSPADSTEHANLLDGPDAKTPATDALHTLENTSRPKHRP